MRPRTSPRSPSPTAGLFDTDAAISVPIIMRQHRARAVGQIAVALVVWSSCLPAVSACSLSTFSTSCDSSQQTTICIVAAGVILLVICGVCLRRRQVQRRAVRLTHVPRDGMGAGQSLNPPKPHGAPVLGGYPVYHQATSPVPPPVYIPQYPPRGYDTYHSHLRLQSTAYTASAPITPVSPASMRAPLNTIPRPISTLDTTSHSLQSSVRREEPTRIVAPSPASPSPALPRSTQTNVAESPYSPPPRSPSVAIPPASVPSPRPSGATAPLNAARPSALAPMHTGISNNVEEPPPAYTPT